MKARIKGSNEWKEIEVIQFKDDYRLIKIQDIEFENTDSTDSNIDYWEKLRNKIAADLYIKYRDIGCSIEDANLTIKKLKENRL